MALILLRHTTPEVPPNVCYGQTDLDVTATFETESAKACAALPTVRLVVTSPLIRCRRLADFVGQQLKLPVEEDCRLMEMDFGTWEGQAWSAVPRAEIDAWAEDFLHARPHGGESVAELRARTTDVLMDWSDSYGSTLVVTHSGVIRAALATGDTVGDFNTRIDFGNFITTPQAQGVPN